jgi:hypothetical protein
MTRKQFKKLKKKLNKTFNMKLDSFLKELDQEVDYHIIPKVEKRFLNRLDAIIAERVSLLHK